VCSGFSNLFCECSVMQSIEDMCMANYTCVTVWFQINIDVSDNNQIFCFLWHLCFGVCVFYSFCIIVILSMFFTMFSDTPLGEITSHIHFCISGRLYGLCGWSVPCVCICLTGAKCVHVVVSQRVIDPLCVTIRQRSLPLSTVYYMCPVSQASFPAGCLSRMAIKFE